MQGQAAVHGGDGGRAILAADTLDLVQDFVEERGKGGDAPHLHYVVGAAERD